MPFLTTFAQLSLRLKNFIGGWLLVLGIKEGFLECATVCVKSVVILIYIMIEVEEITANCRDLGDNFDVDFGNLYPPNPLRLEADNGVITSSNHPNNYNPNEQCGFIIEAPEGSRLVHHI